MPIFSPLKISVNFIRIFYTFTSCLSVCTNAGDMSIRIAYSEYGPASVYSRVESFFCGISDHDAVFMIKRMRLPKLKAPPKHLNVKNYKKFDLKAFKKDMINVPFDEIKYISSDANEMWNLWKRFFLDILNKRYQDKIPRTKSPWTKSPLGQNPPRTKSP